MLKLETEFILRFFRDSENNKLYCVDNNTIPTGVEEAKLAIRLLKEYIDTISEEEIAFLEKDSHYRWIITQGARYILNHEYKKDGPGFVFLYTHNGELELHTP